MFVAKKIWGWTPPPTPPRCYVPVFFYFRFSHAGLESLKPTIRALKASKIIIERYVYGTNFHTV